MWFGQLYANIKVGDFDGGVVWSELNEKFSVIVLKEIIMWIWLMCPQHEEIIYEQEAG